VAAGFPILPADLDRALLADLRRGAPLPETLAGLGLEEPLAPEALAGLREELVASHCGALPGNALDRMVGIQRARDAHLAKALAGAARTDGAVLIAGAGHVRKSAVPLYLARAAPGAAAVSLAFAEVDPAARDLEAVLGSDRGVDYLWMTPRVDDRDPCERFREQLRRLHPGSKTSSGL
jgi:uncharacterized iron-regulated protein